MYILQKKDKLKKYMGNYSIHIFKPVVVLFIISIYSCSSVKESIIYQEFMPTHQSDMLCLKTTEQKAVFSDKEDAKDLYVIQEPDMQENISENTSVSEAIELSESVAENPVNDSKKTFYEYSSLDDIIDLQFYKKYSKIFGINFDGTENPELIISVAEWLDTRFKMGGCSKDGIDCSCLVKSVYKDVYSIELNRTTISIFNDNALIPVKKEDLQEGDLIFFKTKGDEISHVGIYLKNNQFIHASQSQGVIISSLNGKYYRERFVSGKRVPENMMRLAKSYSR